MRAVLVALLAAACGGKSPEAPPVCKHIATVCGATYTEADVQKCAADWPTFQKDFGPAITATFVACTNDATTCTEAQQCSRAAVTALREQAKPRPETPRDPGPTQTSNPSPDPDDPFESNPFFHDNEPLPAECARADELCPKSDAFARRLCREMVGDLRGDPTNLAELINCQVAAKSCAAFKKCRDDMWFKIH